MLGRRQSPPWVPPGPDPHKQGTRVYHRHEPDPIRAAAIEATGVLWGFEDRGSDIPSVDAWEGSLPDGLDGVEFETDVPPDRGGRPRWARWIGPRPGVHWNEYEGRMEIHVRVTKNSHNRGESNG